mgnify:CR=1 FL=1
MTSAELNLMPALPEILLLVTACIVLLAESLKRPSRAEHDAAEAAAAAPGAGAGGGMGLALLALVPSVIATLMQLSEDQRVFAFGGMYVADAMAHLLKLVAYGATALTLVYASGYNAVRSVQRAEFQALALFSLLGVMVMISANNLLVVYLGLELMTLSLYALVALRRDHAVSTEAAMKYFVLGALSSGFLLYGMSMLYGATGSLDIPQIANTVAASANRTALVFGVVFIVSGLAFKFSAVPFHMWAPDVYEGAPTGATLLIAAAPKLATFAVSFRMLVEGLSAVAVDWQQMLMVLAIASLALGNFVGIMQTNLKRLLAYSTISQIGFVLLALSVGVVDGQVQVDAAYGSALFYVVTYVVTTVAGFGALLLLSRAGFESDRIDDLKGLSQRAPWLSLVLLDSMASLAGVPPAVGFYAKLMVLGAVVGAGHVWIAVAAVLLSVVGAYYYLRIVKLMYFDAPVQTATLDAGQGARALLGLNGAAVLLLGILPGPLMAACIAAVRQALGA